MEMKKLIIIGGGGHALSVLEAMDTSIEIARVKEVDFTLFRKR